MGQKREVIKENEFSIDTPLERGVTVLEASAGTGKTYQIVNIFLRLIAEKGVKIDRILAMTFTVAATAEMKDRLRKRLSEAVDLLRDGTDKMDISDELISKWLNSSDREQILNNLYSALTSFDRAQVFTIHGFCLRMLQSFAFETGLEFGTELLEDASEIVEETIAEFYIEKINQLKDENLIKKAIEDGLFEKLKKTLKSISDDPDIVLLPERPKGKEVSSDKERYGAFKLELLHDAYEYLQKELRDKKKKRRVMTYHDLLVFLRDAIRDKDGGDSLRRAISKKYDAILVDEFQDTDVVQWHIFDELFGDDDHYLFLVGDPKQSIYAFRKADVRAYLSACKKAKKRYTIGTNWRSDGALVEAINEFYSKIKNPFDIEEIGYNVLKPANKDDRIKNLPAFLKSPVTFRIPSEKLLPELKNRDDTVDIAIRAVVSDVVTLLNSNAQILENKKWRKISPEDIAILVRENEVAKSIKEELIKRGVPAVIFSENSVLDSEAAEYLLLLLRGILNSSDPFCVRSAIATPLFGLSPEEVLGFDEDRLSEYSQFMEELREIWADKGIAPMINRVLSYRGNLSRIIESLDYERLITDLRHITEILQQRSVEFKEGPDSLFMWFSKQVSEKRDRDFGATEEQLRLESDLKAVNVLTMHKSKGLEFGIVFCPFLWEFKDLTRNDVIRFHREDSENVYYLCKSFVGDNQKDIKEEYKDLAEKEQKQEDLRLAYVAITRARYRSVIYSFLHTYHKNIKVSSFFEKVIDNKDNKGDEREYSIEKLKYSLTKISESSKGLIDVVELNEIDETTEYTANKETNFEMDLKPREFIRSNLDTLVRTSFSGLLKLGSRDDEPRDIEFRREKGPESFKTSEILLPTFPEGVIGGQCIHEIFSRISFKNFGSPEQEGIVKDILGKWGFENYFDEVREMIERVIDYPLDGQITLRGVDDRDRFCEIDFVFSAIPRSGGEYISPRRLSKILREEGGDLEREYAEKVSGLGFAKFTGFLVGKMDLIFRFKDVWYLVDYKTNKIGYSLLDYNPESLRNVMMEEHYMLQYLIYYTALHRYLRHRLKDGYNPERHLGGVFYLFVCGMKDHKSGGGVFRAKPSVGLVEALSGCFGTN